MVKNNSGKVKNLLGSAKIKRVIRGSSLAKNTSILRGKMARDIKRKYGFKDKKVLDAMVKVPRDEFVSTRYKNLAYEDRSLPIGHGQTVSQPYTVAFMTSLLAPKRKDRVLEVGTGSGYQAVVLSFLVEEVFSVERVGKLAKKAKKRVKKMGIGNVHIMAGQGELGWRSQAPFDAIIVTAGIEGKLPDTLLNQLKVGGILVAPVAHGGETVMTKYTKKVKGKFSKRKYGVFSFVPFIKN